MIAMLRRLSLTGFLVAGFALSTAHTQTPQQPPTETEISLYDLALPTDPVERTRLQSAIESALSAEDRPLEHKVRDNAREVRSIIAAARPHPGYQVLDIGSGGGYLALIFSHIVDENGRVDIHNTPGWIAQFPTMAPEVMRDSIHRSNVGFITTPWDAIPQTESMYDIIVLGEVYHDAVLEGANTGEMNRRLFKSLKPGGRLVIEDHSADPTMPLGKQVGLHRIAVEQVMQDELTVGFRLGTSLAIVSLYDDQRFNVFRPGIRGRTDRFILAFEKPSD